MVCQMIYSKFLRAYGDAHPSDVFFFYAYFFFFLRVCSLLLVHRILSRVSVSRFEFSSSILKQCRRKNCNVWLRNFQIFPEDSLEVHKR